MKDMFPHGTLLFALAAVITLPLYIAYAARKAMGRIVEVKDQLRKAYDELEMRVKVRTGELEAANAELHHEIIERQTVEEELRKSEALFRTIFDSTATGITLSDLEGRPLKTNRAFQQMVGYSDAELQGMFFADLTHEGDRGANVVQFQEMLQGQRRHFHMQKRYVHKNGEIVWGQLTISPVLDEKGQATMIIGMIENVSIRRQLEEERLKTSKLESIGVLAGGIAHDFNNLLTAIIGNIALARMHADSGSALYERLAASEKAMTMAIGLTRQLLSLSHEAAPRKKVVAIEDLVRSETNFALSGSSVKGDFQIAPDLWPVEIDISQIGRVINNLVINAREAMPDGGTVEVRAENFVKSEDSILPLASGKYVKIAVIDAGRGVRPEIVSKIFDPYFTTKEIGAQKGTGLGLAICHSVVKRHQGHIEVASVPGGKTTLTIYLPTPRELEEMKTAAPETPPPASSPPDRGRSAIKRILVMDDEEAIIDVAMNMIEYLGHTAEAAADGEQALRKYQEAMDNGTPFDLVILDLTIRGGMGGAEVVGKLREIDPDVKAVVASGYSDDPVIMQCRDYGFHAAINKPFSIEGLGEAILQALDG